MGGAYAAGRDGLLLVDDEELEDEIELELGKGESDVGSDRTAADLFLYVPGSREPDGLDLLEGASRAGAGAPLDRLP